MNIGIWTQWFVRILYKKNKEVFSDQALKGLDRKGRTKNVQDKYRIQNYESKICIKQLIELFTVNI